MNFNFLIAFAKCEIVEEHFYNILKRILEWIVKLNIFLNVKRRYRMNLIFLQFFIEKRTLSINFENELKGF